MSITVDTGPFSLCPLWVLERLTEINQTEALRLYVGLSKWTNGNDRQCHPSRSTIAKYIGCSSKTVDRYVTVLVAIGALSVRHRVTEDGDPTSNEYRVHTSLPSDTDDTTPSVASVPTPGVTDDQLSIPNSKVDPIKPDSSPQLALRADVSPAFFDSFLQEYGNLAGSGRKKAKECWDNAIARGSDPAEIIAGLIAWVAYWRTPEASKAMYAQGFLNQEKWLTPPPPVRTNKSRNVQTLTNPSLAAQLAAIDARNIDQKELTQ